MKKKAFTLIELLVVIAIIALLVSILLPSLQRAKSLAQTAVCLSTMRGLSSAFGMYHADEDGTYPGWDGLPDNDPATEDYAISWNIAFVLKEYVPDYNFFDCPEDMETNVTELSDAPTEFPQKAAFSEYGYNYMSLGMKNGYVYGGGYSGHDFTPAKDSDLVNPAETICLVDSASSHFGSTSYGQLGYYVVGAFYNTSATGMPAARHNKRVNIQWADGHCETSAAMPDLPDNVFDYAGWNANPHPYMYAPFDNGGGGASQSDNYWSIY